MTAITQAQPAPAGRGQRPGGGQQQDEADQGQGRERGRRLVQHGVAGGGQRARADQQPVHEVRAVAAVAVSDRAMPSSSQPTGCAGRRAATTAPTVAELTIGQDGNGDVREGELDQVGPAGLAQQLVQPRHGARQSRLASHSAHASPAVHRRGRPGPAVDVIAVVLAARSAPPIRPPPTLVSLQCGQPASGQRYGGQTGLGWPEAPTNQQRVTPCLPCRRRPSRPVRQC